MTKFNNNARCAVIAGAVWLSTTSIAQAGSLLMVPDSAADRILLFDAYDGSLVDDNFIDGDGLFRTPINAIQVKNEIWVSDQFADSIFRYDLKGNFLSTITGGLDNIRGMEYVNGTVYVSNAGDDNGAPGDGEVVLQFDSQGNYLGFFDTGDPYDIFAFNGELLISDINRDSDGGEDIDRYDFDGNFLGTFHESDGVTGIDFPQQIAQRANGNLLVAGFTAPGGIYEYDANGNQIGVYDGDDGFAARVRGVFELGNGNILWSGGDGIVSTNLETGVDTNIYTIQTLGFRPGTRYIEPLTVPEPGALLGLLSVGTLGLIKRRRRNKN
ncbi:MAG: PEP-CTERM sorting domain-containing protein [Cyanobacteria bacterium P01_F01_bin.153]